MMSICRVVLAVTRSIKYSVAWMVCHSRRTLWLNQAFKDSQLAGIEKVDISLESQSVIVDADQSKATYEAVLEKIKKTGRTVKGGETLRA